jgi:HEAT repeat protein
MRSWKFLKKDKKKKMEKTMQSKKSVFCFFLLILLTAAYPVNLVCQNILYHPRPDENLSGRWDWALNEVGRKGIRNGFWIGYSIKCLMEEHSYMLMTEEYSMRGSFSHHVFLRGKALEKILYGKETSISLSEDEQLKRVAKDALTDLEGRKKSRKKVWKEVAVLYKVKAGQLKIPEMINYCNITIPFDLHGKPLLWLGNAKDSESVVFLQSLYEEKAEEKVKKRVLSTIGIHSESEIVVPVLEKVLTGRDPDSLRARAASELGDHDTEHVVELLFETAKNDRSYDVRKRAIYGLEDVDLSSATDALIEIARNADHPKLRQRAISCLGDKASRKAVSALEDFVYEDDDTEVQKRAVYALEDLPNGEGLPYLIKIANSHPKSTIRKRAIYCLGDSSDPRALEALIKILKKK